jgi:hypothetical protein
VSEHEPDLLERLDERPSLSPRKASEASARAIGIRFAAGAATSLGAGLVTLAFGATAGGLFLAFPAILAASLTQIEQEDDSVDAREDARGAIVGGLALAAFAIVAAVLFGAMPGGFALAAATGAWVLLAISGYALLWGR